MSDLAIEWGDEQLVVLQGKVSGKHVNAKRAAVLTWPEEIDPNKAPAQAAEWLKGELTSSGFSSKAAVVSLPRESVVVRHLELPNVPDGDLPNMVKLQAATKVTMAQDKYLLDFIPLPPRGTETRDVLMTTVPTEVTDLIKQVLTGAGIEIESIGVTSFHSGELVAHQQDAKTRAANQLHLSVALAGDRVELALLRGNCALATSSTRIDREGDAKHKAINAEINRLRLSAQSLHGGLPISHVWVTPADAQSEALSAFLQDKLNCSGSCFDPLGGTGSVADGDRGYFNAVAGHMLASGSSLTEAVNYLDPRKPVQKQDRSRLKVLLGGLGLVLVFSAGYWMYKQKLSNIEQDTKVLTDQIGMMKDNLRKGKPDLESFGEVDRWASRQSNWMTKMTDLQDLMPTADRLIVEKMEFRSGATPPPKEKLARMRNKTLPPVVIIQLAGIAATRREVEDFTDTLQVKGYQPGTPVIEDSSRDEDYPWEFTLRIAQPDPEDPATKS